MDLRGTIIEDTFAEAFVASAARLVITADEPRWALLAATEATGFASSVIGCDCEAGVERTLSVGETPDGRPGVAAMFFAFKPQRLAEAVPSRVGQCVLPCPTTAVFDGLATGGDAAQRFGLGEHIRHFGDGHERPTTLGDRDCWAVPVMEGQFTVEERFTVAPAVAGGNFYICGRSRGAAIDAAERAVDAIAPLGGVVTPFAGGVVRAGSKVGSRYEGVVASTHERYCPTLRGTVPTALREGVACVYEIVIDGLTESAVCDAMRAGITAACGPGIVAISAGHFDGKLGKIKLPLREIIHDT